MGHTREEVRLNTKNCIMHSKSAETYTLARKVKKNVVFLVIFSLRIYAFNEKPRAMRQNSSSHDVLCYALWWRAIYCKLFTKNSIKKIVHKFFVSKNRGATSRRINAVALMHCLWQQFLLNAKY